MQPVTCTKLGKLKPGEERECDPIKQIRPALGTNYYSIHVTMKGRGFEIVRGLSITC